VRALGKDTFLHEWCTTNGKNLPGDVSEQILLHRVLSLPDVIELVIVRMRDNWLCENNGKSGLVLKNQRPFFLPFLHRVVFIIGEAKCTDTMT